MVELRQLFDSESSTYTYLLIEPLSKEALIIDPVREQFDRDAKLITDLGLTLLYALDTHIHADHVTSLGEMRRAFKCKTGLSAKSGADGADLNLKEKDEIRFGSGSLKVIETPGHTSGCLTYHVAGRIFTGDALFVRGCGRTDFQGGCAESLYDSVTTKLFALPDSTMVFPGHDYKGFTCTTIAEEKHLNPRLTKNRTEFVTFMKELKLADPKKILEAVPLNMHCGDKKSA